MTTIPDPQVVAGSGVGSLLADMAAWFAAFFLIGLCTLLIAALSAYFIGGVWTAVGSCFLGGGLGLLVGAWWASRRGRRLGRPECGGQP